MARQKSPHSIQIRLIMTEITISQDKQKLDFDVIYTFLSAAYWSEGRSRSMVRTTIKNSICFGVYSGNNQIGFARVVSDESVFAYLMDVFILSDYQGKGYGTKLMAHILNDPKLKSVQNWLLATSDAHGLYEKFGFKALPNPNKLMRKVS